ncbi:metallophosphoesterase [Bacillaceae bacterium W0354]
MMLTMMTMLALPMSAIIYKGYKNTQAVSINKINVNNASDNATSINVLQLSDIHLENISVSPEQLYESLKEEEIDLIALTGDFMDRKRSIPKLLPYLIELKKINPKYGMYAVFGNHDYVLKGDDFNQLKKLLNNHGVKTLQNESESIEVNGKTLNIIGIDDYGTKHSNLGQSYATVNVEEGFNLVLTHDPNVVLEMKNYHFDYLLSGHFHGGQIHWPKPYHLKKMGELVRMNMTKGLHYIDDKPFYISEGLGQTGVNIRIGSRPEITIHQLKLSPIKNEKTVTA